jgi:predicted MPP superfamily phosphohydrolase
VPGEVNGSTALSRRAFLKLACGALLSATSTCVLGPLYVTQLEPRWIEVTRVDVTLPGLPGQLHGFTVAHLSDFHLGEYVGIEHVRRAVEMTNRLAPDLIVLTGDFVYGSATYSAACAEALESLEATLGVHAVLGNHDVWTDADQVAANLIARGISLLRNEARVLDLGSTRLWLLGLEDTGYTAGFLGGCWGEFQALWQETRDALAAMLEAIPPDEPRLLLVHNPDFTEMLPDARIDLALSGHTHGGQVRLPLVGALVVPSCFGQKYSGGLAQAPNTPVYVSRGIGLIAPPLRFNCRPEITLLRFQRA